MNVTQLAETSKILPALLLITTGSRVQEIALGEASVFLVTWTNQDGSEDALHVTMTDWEALSPNLLIQQVVKRIVLSTLNPSSNERH